MPVALIAGGLLALLVAIGAYVIAFGSAPIGDPVAWAAFGDYLGGVAGPFIGAATLVGVGAALSLQRRELVAARKELLAVRRTMREQTAQARRLAFDATFFNQLASFTTAGERANPPQRVDELSQRRRDERFNAEAIEATYMAIYDDYEPVLGPYFRLLFQLVKSVDTNEDLDDRRKRGYVNLVRAQLGVNDLILLLMNVDHHPEGREGLRPFVEKYGLLKHARNLDKPAVFVQQRAASDLHANAFRPFKEMTPLDGSGGAQVAADVSEASCV